MEHYKVCLLGRNNNIIKTILFNGLDDTSKPKITNVVHSNQLIHLDDSIRVIKNKILKEFGLSTISYNEVYLFSKIPLQDSLLDVYRFLTNQDTEPLTIDKFSNFLANIIDNVGLFIKMTKKDFYTYDDLLTIFQGKTDIHIHIPIGQKFETKFDYSFSTNPYHLKNNTTNSLHNMFSFENSLLLNYGELFENTLYVCLAEDVFEYGEKEKLNMDSVSQYYYPFLYKNEIRNVTTLNEEKQKLIQETNANINDQTWKLYETVDMFYNIFDKRTTNLPYIKTGITSFKFIIHTDFKNILPLDTIFKNIHSTKQIPFIKYNPGFRMENIFRLYSEKTSTTGKKIPFLKSAEIFRLTRELGKSGQISLYIRDEFHGQTIELYMNFHKDGNIYIQSNLQNPLPLYDERFEGKKLILEILLQNFLNPIIDNLNSSLYETGYQIKKMISLNDSNIEVDSIHYYYELAVTKKIDLNKYSGCITSILTIENTDLTSEKGALFKFKRVENYQEMDPITLFIHNEYNKSREVEYVIHELIKQKESVRRRC